MKIKSSILIATLAASVFFGVSATPIMAQQLIADDFHETPLEIFMDRMSLGERIHKKIKAGVISFADYEKLDFSFPDEAGYGDEPKYEIFNPKGPLCDCKEVKAPTRSSYVDTVVTDKDTHLVFNLWRIVDKERDLVTDRLYVFAPNIKPEVCPTKEITKIDWPVQLMANNHEVVENEKPIPNGCVQLQDGKVYIARTIVSRTKNSKNEKWR